MRKIVNLFAGPGSGKSTLAAGLFHILKSNGVKCELVTEFAKEMVYARRTHEMSNQFFVSATQFKRIDDIFQDSPDTLVICDSPILLGLYYGQSSSYRNELEALLYHVHNTCDNFNVFVERTKPYQPYGRTQSEDEAREIDDFFNNLNINFNLKLKGDAFAPLELVTKMKESYFPDLKF